MQKIAGVVVLEAPAPLPPDVENRISTELGELKALGVKIDGIRVLAGGGAPRYDFRFPDGELQFKTREKLEKAGFDVGTALGQTRLGFYISKRTTKTEGWQV